MKTDSVRGTTPEGEPYESTLERDLYALLSFDPLVEQFTAQPLTLDFVDRIGVERRYTPDVLIHYHSVGNAKGDIVLGEVKPISIADFPDDDLKDRFAAADRYASARGWSFKIFTERDIRVPRLENAHFLLGYIDRVPPTEAQQSLLRVLAEMGTTTGNALLNRLAPDSESRARTLPVLWYLLASRMIETNLDLELNMNSVIRIPEEASP